MPILYFSLNDPGSITVIQNIMQECRQSLEAKCLGPEDPEAFSRQANRDNLSLCDALVIVISRPESPAELTALPVADSIQGERLRFEIVSAMNLDLMIVPLLLDGAVLPKRRNLHP